MDEASSPVDYSPEPTQAARPRPYFILIPIAFIIGMFAGYFIRGDSVAARTAAASPTTVPTQAAAAAEGGDS